MLNLEYKNQLTESIPVISSLGVEILDVADNFVMLQAPLDININYQGTAFGGSLNTVSILACYLMVHHLLKINNVPFTSLVIQNSSIEYIKPVNCDFYARAELLNEKMPQNFLKMLWAKKIARIELTSNIFPLNQVAADPWVQFRGRFVATI